MSSSPPQFYVISGKDQFGPYDLDNLREALRKGEIKPEDRVRTGMGTPLGTVLMVLETRSKSANRPGHRANSDRLTANRGNQGPRLIWFGVVGCVLLLAVLWMAGLTDSRAVPVVTESMAASDQVPVPRVQPSGPAPSPVPVAVTVVTPPVEDLSRSTTAKALFDGLGVARIHTGIGATLRPAKPNGWLLDFPELNGSWIGITPTGGSWAIASTQGVKLELGGGSEAAKFRVQMFEADGEAFSTTINLAAGAAPAWISIPWSGFTRDPVQRPAVAADGFQGTALTYLSVINERGATRGVRLSGIVSMGRTDALSPSAASVPVPVVEQAPAVVPAAPKVAIPPVAAPIVAGKPTIPENLLVSRRSATDWETGDGAVIADGAEHSWKIGFATPNRGWVGTIPDVAEPLVRESTGVALDVSSGTGTCDLFFQVIETDGESFVARISVAAGVGRRAYDLPWASFTRDGRQKPGVPNDGFTHAGLSYVAFSVRSGATEGMMIHRMVLTAATP